MMRLSTKKETANSGGKFQIENRNGRQKRVGRWRREEGERVFAFRPPLFFVFFFLLFSFLTFDLKSSPVWFVPNEPSLFQWRQEKRKARLGWRGAQGLAQGFHVHVADERAWILPGSLARGVDSTFRWIRKSKSPLIF